MLNVASFYSYGLPGSELLDAVQLLARLERAVAIADYPDARYVTVDRRATDPIIAAGACGHCAD
jgi:hypothetical protein